MSNLTCWCHLASAVQPQPPVEVGQIVLVQLLSAITVEKYSARAGHETSYIRDQSLESSEWWTPRRPALVIKVEWDDRARLYHFTAVAISRRQADAKLPHFRSVPIASPVSKRSSKSEDSIVVNPPWLLEDSCCYAFIGPSTFYCIPSQVSVYFLMTTCSYSTSDRAFQRPR